MPNVLPGPCATRSRTPRTGLAGAHIAALLAVAAASIARPRLAAGQAAVAPPPNASGSGLSVDVAVRRARVAGAAEVLVGGRVARVAEGGFVVGAAAYGLATRSAFRSTYYGGLLLGYVPQFGPFADAGDAGASDAPGGPRLVLHTLYGAGRLGWRVGGPGADNFLVAEPGVELSIPVAGGLRLAADAGWRFVTGVRSPVARNADLRGLTAGVGLQFVRF